MLLWWLEVPEIGFDAAVAHIYVLFTAFLTLNQQRWSSEDDPHSTPLHLQGGPLSHSAKAT